MFTGIVEEIGRIKRNSINMIEIECGKVLQDLKIGDSIAVNGVCLTVIGFDATGFQANVMAVTSQKTNLRNLHSGDLVNLERAMLATSRFDGHIVSGHSDGICKVIDISRDFESYLLELSAPEEIARYIVPQGSVSLNGISLTVVEKRLNRFSVSIIPHTWENTNLKAIKLEVILNLEVDMIGKYLYHFIHKEKGKINSEFLRENGFM